MRKLAIFAFSFAAAAALHVYLLRCTWGLLLGGLLLCAGIVLCFFRGKLLKRARLVALGLAIGFLWSGGYEALRIAPLRSLCGEGQSLAAEICETPEATQWGCTATARIRGGRVRLSLNVDADTLALGDRVTLTADVDSVLYGADWNSLYAQSRDISLTARQCGSLQVEKAARLPLRYWPQHLAEKACQSLYALFPEDTAGLASALLLGEKDGLSYQQQNSMSLSGISHVVAVSGLHLSVLLSALSSLLRHRRQLIAFVALLLLWLFAAVVGFTPSVTRAAVMQTFLLLAPILKRESDTFTALGAALLLLLLENPWAIANVSLQLSFAAVAGILLCTQPIYNWLYTRLTPKPKKLPRLLRRLLATLSGTVATTLGAQLLTTPLSALYFGQISLIAPLSNLLLLPLINLCFVLVLLVLLLGLVYAPLGTLLATLVSWPLRLILRGVDCLGGLPHAAIYTDSLYVPLFLLLCYLMLGLFLLNRGRRPLLLLLGLCVSLVGTIFFSSARSGSLTATVLDVGQGQCILLQCGSTTAMIDCGGDQGDADGEKAARALLSAGVDTVDVLILTHYDADHTAGLAQLLSRVRVSLLLAPDIAEENRAPVLALAAAYDTPVQLVREDVRITFSGGQLDVFAPPLPGDENTGLSVLLRVREYDLFVTGDMDAAAERALLRSHELPDLELLVAGHHGSKYATCEELLWATTPDAVVISVGRNHFGHPTQEVLDRIAALGASVWRTDLDGDIIIKR